MKVPALLAAALLVFAAGTSSNVMAHGKKYYGHGYGGHGHSYYKPYRYYKPRRYYRHKKRHYYGGYRYPSRSRYGIKLFYSRR